MIYEFFSVPKYVCPKIKTEDKNAYQSNHNIITTGKP